MIHAFCSHAKSGTQASAGTCYGQNPGTELWAVYPVSVLQNMVKAYSTHDWSSVAVDGVMRVADVLDAYDPASTNAKSWKTVILFGTKWTGEL